MAAQQSSSSDLVLRDFTMTKYQPFNPDGDHEMTDVGAPSRKINAPLWLSKMYGDLCTEINEMGNVIKSLVDRQQDPREIPGLVEVYNLLVNQQNSLYARQTEELQNAQKSEFAQLAQASSQFATEMRLSVKYAGMSAKEQVERKGKELLTHIGSLATHNMN